MCYYSSGGFVDAPLSSLDTLGLPLGSGLSGYYRKLFPLNILNTIFSRSLKSFEGHLLSIFERNKLDLFLVTCFRISLEYISRKLNKACPQK